MGPGDDGGGGGGGGDGAGLPPPNPPNKRGNSLSSRALSTLLSSTPDSFSAGSLLHELRWPCM